MCGYDVSPEVARLQAQDDPEMLFNLPKHPGRQRLRCHAPLQPGGRIDSPYVIAAEIRGDLTTFPRVGKWDMKRVPKVLFAGARHDDDLGAALVEGIH